MTLQKQQNRKKISHFCKGILTEPKILLPDEPSRGIYLSVDAAVDPASMVAGGMIQNGLTFEAFGDTLYFSVPHVIILAVIIDQFQRNTEKYLRLGAGFSCAKANFILWMIFTP